MASTALVRVTGTVLAISSRQGVSRKDPENPTPWKMVHANVLVANQNVTVVQLPREDEYGSPENLEAGYPVQGDSIDYLAEVSIYGRDVQTRVLSDFPALVAAS